MKQGDIYNLLVSSKVLEDIFKVTSRTIRNLAEEGIIERETHGKYRLISSVTNYITALKAAASSKNVEVDGMDLNLDAERAAHERCKRQITEIKLQLIKGQVHKAEDVEAVMTDMFERFKAKLESLPAKLARQLEGEDKVNIQKILRDEMMDALNELSEYSPSMFYSDDHIDVEEDEINKILDEVSDEGEGKLQNNQSNEKAGKDS